MTAPPLTDNIGTFFHERVSRCVHQRGKPHGGVSMTQPQRKAFRLALILSGAMLLVVAGFALHGATASASTLEAAIASVESGAVLFSPPPPPNQDTCLSCHIAGENKNLWAPLGRWSVFGVFGLVFAFGVYRSASVWTQRKALEAILDSDSRVGGRALRTLARAFEAGGQACPQICDEVVVLPGRHHRFPVRGAGLHRHHAGLLLQADYRRSV